MRWLKPALTALGAVAFAVTVWFAGPLVGFGSALPFEPVWVRLSIIGLMVLALLIWGALKLYRRRRGQAALEKALIADAPAGDGAVLAERMQSALATLKKSGKSKTYLYDLPWYVIIGPPGSGKTTALVNAGIKFPLADQKQTQGQGSLSGFGGTRYCDWWFAEEAVLIDTAGRYTTQDSDAVADGESWSSFLSLLKRNRPKQPINGVILAFSVADLMNAAPETVAAHARTVRARLAEIHETLKVDFPVYVMFTKADLIAGFREYFASFSASRRKKVWGATFQTENRKEPTHDRVGEEFDALVSRLSDEVIDRLSEENDGVSRIAIFGLPGQMAILRDTVADFLRQVFEPTRYKTNAMLRGFYFTSGTQEGTPIDQVLGAMNRSFGREAQAGLMSGRGKSFFLHDLLTQVIFAEQGWVSYDRRAVRRSTGLRAAAMTAMVLATLGLLGAWGVSYFENRGLVRSAQAALADYELAAQEDLQRTEISDTDLARIASELQLLRNMPAGYGNPDGGGGITERFGLGQRSQLETAAEVSYRDGLERLMRPRLILRIEEQLQAFVLANETLAIYETLKVYKLLGGMAPAPEDALIRQWFHEDWLQVYPGINQQPLRDLLEAHLAAMLELDGETDVRVELNGDLIAQAERILGRMSVADQAYSLIQATAGFSGVSDFNLVEQVGPDARLVLETVDGSDLANLGVPALFTYAGFHDFFLDQLGEVARKIESETWVMGEQAEAARVGDQLDRLGPTLLARYRDDFIAAWESMIDNVKLAPLAADKPAYVALAAAASPTTSPILRFVEAISAETRLTAEPEPAGGVASIAADPALLARAQDQAMALTLNRTSGLKRIGLDLALEAGKSQRRAGAAGGGGPVVPGADIEAQFAAYHAMLEGTPGSRPIDALIGNLGAIQQSLVISASAGLAAQAAAQMPALIGQLRTTASRLPPALSRMVAEAVEDFEGDAVNTTIGQINEELTSQVTRSCENIVSNRYPFARTVSRQVPLSEFAQLFAPDGILDRFFNTHLAVHADMGGRDWTWRKDSPLADRLSLATLRQFQRAAKIREAFFPGRSPTVDLEVTINQTAAHDRIKQAVLSVDDQQIITRAVGNTPQAIKWPGLGTTTSLQILPEMNNRESLIRYQGPWAFLQFIRDGNPRQVGDVLQVGYVIGGRNISFDIRVNSLENPFNLAELSEFTCPSGL